MLKCCHRCSTFLSLLCSLCHRSDFHPCKMYDCTGFDLYKLRRCFLPTSPCRNSTDFPASALLPHISETRQANPSFCLQTHTQRRPKQTPSIPRPALTLERGRGRRKWVLNSSFARWIHPGHAAHGSVEDALRGRTLPQRALTVSLSQLWGSCWGHAGCSGSSGICKGDKEHPETQEEAGVGLFWGSQERRWGGRRWDHWLASLLLFALSSLQSFLSFPLPCPPLPSLFLAVYLPPMPVHKILWRDLVLGLTGGAVPVC